MKILKKGTCLSGKIKLGEYLNMIYHVCDQFYQYSIVEEEIQLMNHSKRSMH